MVSYQYAVIHQRGTAIELQITDSAPISQLLDRLSASISGFGASASKLPGGDPYYWRLYGLGQDMEQAWVIIIEHFVSHGWALLDDRCQNDDRTVCFGLLQNEQRAEMHAEEMRAAEMHAVKMRVADMCAADVCAERGAKSHPYVGLAWDKER